MYQQTSGNLWICKFFMGPFAHPFRLNALLVVCSRIYMSSRDTCVGLQKHSRTGSLRQPSDEKFGKDKRFGVESEGWRIIYRKCPVVWFELINIMFKYVSNITHNVCTVGWASLRNARGWENVPRLMQPSFYMLWQFLYAQLFQINH